MNPTSMPAPPPTEDHPDLYIPEEVKHFLPYFEYQIAAKVCNIPLLIFSIYIHSIFLILSRLLSISALSLSLSLS